jgi:paraquat-inducible protein B
MSQKASPALIGAFTLVGLILAVAALVLFGAGKLFSSSHDVLLYFDKSANGLLVGSDVRFGGVRIGRVKSISVLVDRRANRKIIPVVVELADKDLRLIGTDEGGGIDLSTFAGVRKAVAEGLRAGMKQQSLVTGQLYIEFDIVPDTPGFVYSGSRRPPYPVVPTIGTEMDELISGISDGIQKFNALDLDEAVKDLRRLLVSTNQRVEALDVAEINDNLLGITRDVRSITGDGRIPAALDKLNKALADLDELVAKANTGMDPLLGDLKSMMAKTEASLARIDEAAGEIAAFSNPRSPVLLRLQNVLQETERASRALQELSNDLKRNPKALISGKAASE